MILMFCRWSDLWLNEGFASFMECLGTAKVANEWDMMDQFVVTTVQPGLALDGLLSSHPVSTSVHDPKKIEAIFDAISYKKVHENQSLKLYVAAHWF